MSTTPHRLESWCVVSESLGVQYQHMCTVAVMYVTNRAPHPRCVCGRTSQMTGKLVPCDKSLQDLLDFVIANQGKDPMCVLAPTAASTCAATLSRSPTRRFLAFGLSRCLPTPRYPAVDRSSPAAHGAPTAYIRRRGGAFHARSPPSTIATLKPSCAFDSCRIVPGICTKYDTPIGGGGGGCAIS